MATQGLELKVGADVAEAVSGIKILSNQLDRLAKLASLPGISFTQQERLNALLIKTQNQFDKFGKAAQIAGKSAGAIVPGANSASFALTNLGRVAQDAPFGFIGIQNNINPLIESFQRLKIETGSTGGALKALAGSFIGPAGLGVAVSLVTSALTFFSLSQRGATKEVSEAKNETDGYVRKLTEQKEELSALIVAVKNQTLSEEQRNAALKRLNDIIPDSIGFLTKQNIVTAEGVNILNKYVKALEARATAELLINRISENNIKLFDNRNKVLDGNIKFENDLLKLRAKAEQLRGKNQFEGAAVIEAQILNIQQQSVNALANVRKEQEKILIDNQKLRDEYQRILPTTIALEKLGKEQSSNTNKATDAINEQSLLLENQLISRTKISDASALDLRNLREAGRTLDELIKKGEQRAGIVIPSPADPSQRAAPSLITVSDEDLAGLLSVEEKLLSINDTINNGLNAGIDQFFNAIANNQDPFEALIQSAKRLIVELGAAVAKALLLQVISAAISGGSSAAKVGGSKFFGLVRGGDINLTLLRSLGG